MHIRDEDVHVFHSYDYCPCLKTSCLCTARKIQATPINNFGLAVWVTVSALLSWSLESPVVLLCMQMSHCSPCAAKGFHSHSNHPSSILPHLLYSSACPALPSATRAEAQWSAVERSAALHNELRSKRRRKKKEPECARMDADMKHSPPKRRVGAEKKMY